MGLNSAQQPLRNGFTLIELLMVLFIIGLLASAVVLSIPQGNSDLDEDAQRFAARVAALRDNAILQSRPMAVQVTPSGYAFLQRRAGEWVPLEDKPFQSTNWSSGIAPNLGEGGELRIAFESTGLVPDPAGLTLRSADLARTIKISTMGEIRLDGDRQEIGG